MPRTRRAAPAVVPTAVPTPALDDSRVVLEQLWRRRVDEIGELSVHLHDMRAALVRAAGDGGGFDVEVELIESQLVAARRGLDEVEAALARLADGSYGCCAECGRAIAPERLEVLPEARLCTPCQARARR